MFYPGKHGPPRRPSKLTQNEPECTAKAPKYIITQHDTPISKKDEFNTKKIKDID